MITNPITTLKLFVILLISLVNANAQDTFTIDAKKISETETPVTIVQAIATDFPDAQAQAYYVMNGEDIKSDWVISEEDNLQPGEKVDHYSVLLKGKKGGSIYGLYNKDGKLQMVKIIALDFALPTPIATAATSGKYKGYAVKSDKFARIINKKKDKEYVEVVVSKGSDTKKLYFTPDGKLIKEK